MTQPVDSEHEQSLASRYGLRPARRGRRVAGAAIAVLLAAILAWVVWAAWGQSRDGVGALVQSYRITSPHEMSVTVQITRTSTAAVHCTVSAIATDHSEVGQTVIALPAGPSGTRTRTATIKTERAATSVDIGHCR